VKVRPKKGAKKTRDAARIARGAVEGRARWKSEFFLIRARAPAGRGFKIASREDYRAMTPSSWLQSKGVTLEEGDA
jgi:hypothetical protein